jgi:TPR repeat protein
MRLGLDQRKIGAVAAMCVLISVECTGFGARAAESCSDPHTVLNFYEADPGFMAQYPDYVPRLLKTCETQAESGNAIAQYVLGWVYYNGWAVKKDTDKGLKLLQQSADQGYATAQFQLGAEYTRYPDSPGSNWDKGLNLLHSAADQGQPAAQSALAFFYEHGALHVLQDYVQAYMWLNLACASEELSDACVERDDLSKKND